MTSIHLLNLDRHPNNLNDPVDGIFEQITRSFTCSSFLTPNENPGLIGWQVSHTDALLVLVAGGSYLGLPV